MNDSLVSISVRARLVDTERAIKRLEEKMREPTWILGDLADQAQRLRQLQTDRETLQALIKAEEE